MIHEQPVRLAPAPLGEQEPSMPANAGRCRTAIKQLHSAFNAPRPLVILAGHWSSDRHYITRNFLADLQSEVAFIHIDKSCSDALQGMREVVRGTGFEPADMRIAELDRLFENYLSYQLAQHRRTILLIEESHDDEGWVRDKVRQLVTLESDRKYGLMIVLFRPISRKPKMNGRAKQNGLAPNGHMPRVLSVTPMVNRAGIELGSITVDESLTPPMRMVLTHNGERVREITMEQPRLMIGSASDNDICIKDEKVSRYHALLVRFGDTAFVRDLNSRGGTYVNMSRVKDQMVIHQDILTIGNHRIKFIAPS